MSLMGTLAKVAIGYATARGVDKMAGSGGLGALLGGQQTEGSAEAANPMADMMKQMMEQNMVFYRPSLEIKWKVLFR